MSLLTIPPTQFPCLLLMGEEPGDDALAAARGIVGGCALGAALWCLAAAALFLAL